LEGLHGFQGWALLIVLIALLTVSRGGNETVPYPITPQVGESSDLAANVLSRDLTQIVDLSRDRKVRLWKVKVTELRIRVAHEAMRIACGVAIRATNEAQGGDSDRRC
jgi:hypothetical protein